MASQPTPSNDALYHVLSNKRRRYALHYLKQRDEPVSVRELAEQVAAWENEKSVEELTSQERKRVYISLYQSHLSTLDENDIVEYDEDRGLVSLPESMNDIELYLELVPSNSIPWSMYYAGLSIANGLLLLLAWFQVEPFTLVPEFGWSAIIVATFGTSALVQHYYNRQRRLGDEGPPPELE